MNTDLLLEQRRHAIKYFITKFEAIPEEKWCTGVRHNNYGQSCALGHTHARDDWNQTPETKALASLFTTHRSFGPFKGEREVADINNGDNLTYRQSTPKRRILAALRDLLSL